MNAKEIRMQKMVEEIEDYAILLLDRNGTIENWNKGAEKLKGYTPQEAIGKKLHIFYTPEDLAHQRPDLLIRTAAEKGSVSDVGWRVRKDGSRFWGRMVITAIHDEQGEVIGFTKVTRDLTDKKLAEEAQLRYMQQLETRSKEMEQLAYIASHDLQEPLRTINSFLSLFQSRYVDTIDEEGKMYIDVIMQSSGRMQELIKGILEYSILGTKKELTLIDCNELLKQITTDLATSINNSGAAIQSAGLPVLYGYRTELRQLFQNLISNALKFSRPGVAPIISIHAEEQTGKWLFTVQDNGIGMDQRFIHKIFLIFQRLNAREAYSGTGIGLAHAKKIAELHLGEIWADSKPGEGSTFYFTINTTLPHEHP